MYDKLLLKCKNTIEADQISYLLHTNNIPSRQHDESQDQHHGAYGPITGITIYVLEQDYETAETIIQQFIETKSHDNSTFCPKCGSEDLLHLVRRKDYTSTLLVLSIFLFIIPALYCYYYYEFSFRSSTINYIALAMFISGIVIIISQKYFNYNYKCKRCGKKFYKA